MQRILGESLANLARPFASLFMATWQAAVRKLCATDNCFVVQRQLEPRSRLEFAAHKWHKSILCYFGLVAIDLQWQHLMDSPQTDIHTLTHTTKQIRVETWQEIGRHKMRHKFTQVAARTHAHKHTWRMSDI